MRWRQAVLAVVVLTLQWAGACAPAFGAETRALVLVSSKASQLPSLSQAEVRRLYLGKPIDIRGVHVVPLRNAGDPLLYEVFLQKVVYMSAQSYERLVLAHVYQSGGQRPPMYEESKKLLGALQQDPGSVTFMWRSEAQAIPDIEIVQVLWQEAPP
jgi:hypothetical protein